MHIFPIHTLASAYSYLPCAMIGRSRLAMGSGLLWACIGERELDGWRMVVAGRGHGRRHNRQACALCKAIELNKQLGMNDNQRVLILPDNISTVIEQ